MLIFWFLVGTLSATDKRKSGSGPVPICHGPTTLRQTETNLILGRSGGRDVVLIVNKVAPADTTGLNVSNET
jgi:hypothetical protein